MPPRTKKPPANDAYYVYVALNKAGIAYTGIAKDVAARLAQHNTNTGARFTKGRGPWHIAHTEGPLTHSEALRREMEIKKDRRLKAAVKAGRT
ncbi:MAG: GIY-YIG nuclease family protein [Rhodospirillales bacterium]|nr:GIY-YIG nuclease family protein [Rhodospirillales bacterium]